MKGKRQTRSLITCLLLGMAWFYSPLNARSSYSATDCTGIPLDHKLIEILNLENGVFIEVGANDGITQSNTKLLEEILGWKGILVEPSPILYPRLCANRPHSTCFMCALGSFEESDSYTHGDFDGNLMSSIHGDRLNRTLQKTVRVRALQSILDEMKIEHVNFFSLDTEGYELNILNGIDFSRTQIDYMLIEIYKHQYDAITAFLYDKGYELVECLSNYNPIDNPFWDGTHNDYLFKRTH